MYYKVNFNFKTYGFNKNATMCLILDDLKQVEIFISGYKSIVESYEIYKYESICENNKLITIRTKI